MNDEKSPLINGVVKSQGRTERDERSSNVEYVSEQLDLTDAGLEAFSDVFARFQLPPEESSVRRTFSLFSPPELTYFWDFVFVAGQIIPIEQQGRNHIFRR